MNTHKVYFLVYKISCNFTSGIVGNTLSVLLGNKIENKLGDVIFLFCSLCSLILNTLVLLLNLIAMAS